MFDETYIHQAENRTDVSRVILFCDIERPLSNPVLRWINRTISRGMIRAAATQNVPGEHVGLLNHIFSYVYQIRALGERIKHWNKPMYYALKWTLLAALGYALIVGF
jgi:beta-hydroxylase